MEKYDDSPSFSTYSGDRLSEIAERVGRRATDRDYTEKVNDEFEFAILQTDRNSVSSTNDGGGIVFPVFNQNLISDNNVSPSPETLITPLKDLFLRERKNQPPQQNTYSSSSDEEEEEDELGMIPSEIYCPRTPARSTAEMSPSGGWGKSNSTGSSSTKRWRIRDLLKRSHSDGKQSLKFLNSNSINKNYTENGDESLKKMKKKEKVSSAHEKFYLRNKAIKEEDKRKSYLPYKQNLFGFFANINRYGKTSPPF